MFVLTDGGDGVRAVPGEILELERHTVPLLEYVQLDIDQASKQDQKELVPEAWSCFVMRNYSN